jgi:hypothetical protein
MVSRSARKFEVDSVRRSFHICSFEAMGQGVPREELHSRLREAFNAGEIMILQRLMMIKMTDDPESAEIASAGEAEMEDSETDVSDEYN